MTKTKTDPVSSSKGRGPSKAGRYLTAEPETACCEKPSNSTTTTTTTRNRNNCCAITFTFNLRIVVQLINQQCRGFV